MLKAVVIPAAALVLAPSDAYATSQWSRKYGVACTVCHSPAFPRLNYHGERFMRNGYQDVGSQDGDTAGKQAIGSRLFLDDVGNFLGVRLNVVPLRIRSNELEAARGAYRTAVQVGNADWLQLFAAGSVLTNVSVFIETEVSQRGEVHSSWFRLGFHNLAGPTLNAWVGVMDPLELHATSGRLPMLPSAPQEIFYVRTSNGKGDDSVNLRSGRPAIAVFGAAGPVVYEIGLENGSALSDPNHTKNVWGTLRLEATDGPIEGSSVSVFGYFGQDTKKLVDATRSFTGTATNDFWRASVAANLRWSDLDVLGGFVYGRDDNWLLMPRGNEAYSVFEGVFFQLGHPLGNDFHVAAQYDGIWSDNAPTIELQKVALGLSYLLRENFRFILMPRADIQPISAAHPRRQHEATLMIRTMF